MSTARSPKSAAWETTPLATRFTRATGDCDLLRVRLRPLLFRLEARLLDFRAALRPLPLRLEDFRAPRDALRALPALRLLARFLAPPRLRPEEPDRDGFLPLFERLDFLAAAMGMLRVGGS